MTITLRILLGLCLLQVGCASQAPKNTSVYDVNTIAPQETEYLVLTNTQTYDDPLMGVALSYADRRYRSDIITVYIYPIAATNWEDQDATIAHEMRAVLAEVDQGVAQGSYTSRGQEDTAIYEFDTDGQSYRGLKTSFELYVQPEIKLHSNAYIFISQDKFIKFRTSFDSRATVEWNGDAIVQTLLPKIKAPAESIYMRDLRHEIQQRALAEFLQQMIQTQQQESP